MYDHPHPRYLDYNHKRRLKSLNQDFHDGILTCKHDFIDIEHLSRLRSQILIVMIFRIFSFDVDFVNVFKTMS